MSLLWSVNERDEPPDEFDMDGDDCISDIFESHCIYPVLVIPGQVVTSAGLVRL